MLGKQKIVYFKNCQQQQNIALQVNESHNLEKALNHL